VGDQFEVISSSSEDFADDWLLDANAGTPALMCGMTTVATGPAASTGTLESVAFDEPLGMGASPVAAEASVIVVAPASGSDATFEASAGAELDPQAVRDARRERARSVDGFMVASSSRDSLLNGGNAPRAAPPHTSPLVPSRGDASAPARESRLNDAPTTAAHQ
jgi:hypothetical protein